jgi:UDP-N-acetylglucosamine--N-acetylmuramyl-(pentapeptide) pyrophosphoryl-undecaprenol N-acetylglucosamine transferase
MKVLSRRGKWVSQASSKAATVVIAAGGTAGHVYPALAMAETFRSTRPEIGLVFAGGMRGLERELVRRHGFEFVGMASAPYHRTGVTGRLKIPWSLAKCTTQARRLLRETHSALAVGFGGHVTAGVFLAARSLGIPFIVHEANVTPGLANRLFGGSAAQVFLSWEQAAPAFPAARTQVVGLPVRSSILQAISEARALPEPGERPLRILVTGGSEGSPFLNRNTPSLAAALVRLGVAVEVVHQRGFQDEGIAEAAYRSYSIDARVLPFIDDIADVYRWADFAVTCAGASTLTELAVMRLPALVVPLGDASDDHQTANARAAAETSALWWTSEAGWDSDRLAARLAALSRDRRAWSGFSDSMRNIATHDAAEHMLRYCVRTLE